MILIGRIIVLVITIILVTFISKYFGIIGLLISGIIGFIIVNFISKKNAEIIAKDLFDEIMKNEEINKE